MLLNYHVGRIVLQRRRIQNQRKLCCVMVCVRCDVVCRIFVVDKRIYVVTDSYGNSTEQSQAPGDEYINVRNMLSTLEVK